MTGTTTFDRAGFRRRLVEARVGKDLTITQLAKRAAVGRRAIYLWEGGEATPSVENLARLCGALAISSDWLLGVQDHALSCEGNATKQGSATPKA